MAAYIPKEMYNDITNEAAVHKIFSTYFSSDVLDEPPEKIAKDCRKELRQLGEDRIAATLEKWIVLG